jgi:hypothetical protein
MTTGRAALACHQSHVHNLNKSQCRWQFHRPQSSSASRFTADASGFYILSQSGDASLIGGTRPSQARLNDAPQERNHRAHE